jgi:hypothetical protein
MTVKERVINLIESLPDTPENERWLKSIATDLSANGTSNGGSVKAKKVGRLSFSGIGASDASDVSERFEEYLGLAIDKRHPRS